MASPPESTDNIVFQPRQRNDNLLRAGKSANRGPYVLADLTYAASEPSLQFEWRGVVLPEGRSWRFRQETLQQLEEDDRIFQRRRGQVPNLKIFLNEDQGVDVETIWTDIPRLAPRSTENTQYPNQKPLGLLERLLHKGSHEDEVVLDPFCGSGTTIVAAERHRRQWIACDTSNEAIEVAKRRLSQEFSQLGPTKFVIGDAGSLTQFTVKPSEFRRVAVAIEEMFSIGHSEFILNRPVLIEETRHFEFKEVRSTAGAVDSIVNASDNYAVAFLNGEGGRVYWGIRNEDRVVVGVRLNYAERDKVRRDVTSKLNQIEPRVDPSRYRLELHEVSDEHGEKAPDVYVVELVVPASHSTEPHYTRSGEAWVRVDGANQKVKGIALTDFIKRRLVPLPIPDRHLTEKRNRMLADLISELEDNFRTATSFTSGLPGCAVYLPPSIEIWKSIRNDLAFLDLGTFNEVKETYEQIDRWHGIVASGINPGLGNLEIPQITNALRIRLPALIAKLRESR